MYTLYTDKSETLQAKIKVEGVSSKNVKCRVILESDKWSLMVPGKISSNGDCSVKIGALGEVLSDGDEGNMILEVIADDTLFSIWDEKFEVKKSKSITVESVTIGDEADEKPSVVVTMVENSNKTYIDILQESKNLSKKLINNKAKPSVVVAEYFEDRDIPKEKMHEIINNTINMLSSIKK
jgi:hypothetical protein